MNVGSAVGGAIFDSMFPTLMDVVTAVGDAAPALAGVVAASKQQYQKQSQIYNDRKTIALTPNK